MKSHNFQLIYVTLIISCTFLYVYGYETKYDDIDIDSILKSERLLSNYVKCLLNEGPCTADATELKNSLPDATQSDCSKCTEKQKIGSDKVTHYLIDNKPELWERLAKIYDKQGVFKAKYLAEKAKLAAESGDDDEK